MRQPVAVAYLLARAADTIADTRALPPQERLERLLAFRAEVEDPAPFDKLRMEAVGRIVSGVRRRGDGASPAETALLDSVGGVFSLLDQAPESDRARIRSVVGTLTGGMELDLTTFPAEDSGVVAALQSAEELDCYTYLVAGCVGGFWTSVAMAHEPRLARWDAGRMSDLGVRFGKALQLTNVLRDVPRDLRNGRCYLPEPELASAGLTPDDLLDPANAGRARPVLTPWIRVALEHFDAAEAYLLATPRRCLRTAAGGAVAHPAGPGDAGETGPQRCLAGPGAAFAGKAALGVWDDGPLVAGRTVGYAATAVDSRTAPQGGEGAGWRPSLKRGGVPSWKCWVFLAAGVDLFRRAGGAPGVFPRGDCRTKEVAERGGLC